MRLGPLGGAYLALCNGFASLSGDTNPSVEGNVVLRGTSSVRKTAIIHRTISDIVEQEQPSIAGVHYSTKTVMNPSGTEFQLIEVMKIKMQMIQFDSIVNLIQMKLMKVSHKIRNMMIQEFQYLNKL
jgi:GTPase SAR1 family protein